MTISTATFLDFEIKAEDLRNTLVDHFGYRQSAIGGGLTALQREADEVFVPASMDLSPTLVRAILRTAKVDLLEFIEALQTDTLTKRHAA